MVFQILIYSYRRPDITPAEFKNHYENNHIPLVQTLAGPDFPITHTRHYVSRAAGENEDKSGGPNANFPASVLVGNQSDFDFDAVSVLTFKDQVAFETFFAKAKGPEVAEKLKEDEEMFLDRSRMVAVGVDDVIETRCQG